MKYGIFSDVHANLEALEAVLAKLVEQGATRFLCLGDLVGYGPDPNACIERIRSLRARVVAGNHDYGAIRRTSTAGFNQAAREALAWTGKQLTRHNRLYLENLPLADVRDSIHMVHASPSAPDRWEYVLTLGDAEDEIEYFSETICLLGHSHHPFVVECPSRGRCRLIRTESFRLSPGAKYVINAGSVGQPRDGDTRACCLLYDINAATLTFFRVPYDIATTQEKIRRAGLPESLATRLSHGY